MILIIRISGQVDLSHKVKETLDRINIRRKYAATLLPDNENTKKLINKITNFIAFGTIDKETLKQLIEKRAQPIDKTKKLDTAKIIEQIEKVKMKDLNLKPFFRLHPAIGGIDSKNHFGTSSKAVLGNNKEKINDLVRRML